MRGKGLGGRNGCGRGDYKTVAAMLRLTPNRAGAVTFLIKVVSGRATKGVITSCASAGTIYSGRLRRLVTC